jgi:predicted branched-subunit amino acid permease
MHEFAHNLGVGENMDDSSSSKEFWQGVRAELPILVGVLPFGMIFLAVRVALSSDPINSGDNG